MNQKATVGSAVPSLSDVHEREGQDRPLYATRVIGQEVWKAEVLLTPTGVSIGYIKRRERALLGFAMDYVKDDDSTIEYQQVNLFRAQLFTIYPTIA